MSLKVVPPTVPKEVAPHLLPDEQQVITVRKHPMLLIVAALPLLVDATAFALHATGVVRGSSEALAIRGILIAPCCLLFFQCLVTWWRGYFVITSNRMLISGWWRPWHVTVVPITDAGDMTFIRTLAGRLFGYGTFQLRHRGGLRGARKIRFLPYPEQLYLETTSLIFPRQELADD